MKEVTAKYWDSFSENAAPEAIAAYLHAANTERRRIDRYIAKLEVLLERRTAEDEDRVTVTDLPDFADCGSGCRPDNKPRPVIVEEHGHLMSSGEVHVWSNDPDAQRIYPLAERIEHGKRHGGTVLRRRVIVLDEWEEV